MGLVLVPFQRSVTWQRLNKIVQRQSQNRQSVALFTPLTHSNGALSHQPLLLSFSLTD